MKRKITTIALALASSNAVAVSFLVAASTILPGAVSAHAQCTILTSGLRSPLGTALTHEGNLLVSESGTMTPNSGRISIVEPNGHRRTLLRGLPAAPNDVGDPSGPAGLFMNGRHLFLLMGTGDAGIAGPRPGTTLENPNGPSSPIFSSVLHIYFTIASEKTTKGFTLRPADQAALANGQTVTLSDGSTDKMLINLVVDFPNFVPSPLPDVPDNISVSNPFHLTDTNGVNRMLYVTDGGRNLLWQVNLDTKTFSPLVVFPNIPNPLFPNLGGPFLQAVPTGVAFFRDHLYVTLLRGAPFPTGTSTVEQIDLATGSDTPFITGLTTAIDVLPMQETHEIETLVLEISNAGPFFQGPGEILGYDVGDSTHPPASVTNCLSAPTSMTLDRKSGRLYVSELGGRIVVIPFP